jgi:uncharacterized protein YqfB (UPF0267 family)
LTDRPIFFGALSENGHARRSDDVTGGTIGASGFSRPAHSSTAMRIGTTAASGLTGIVDAAGSGGWHCEATSGRATRPTHAPHAAQAPALLTTRKAAGYLTGMLLFKKKFLAAIRDGQKTQTIRLWKYRRMRPGQRSYIPGAGYIRITAVDEVALETLTDADALPDGFATADQLRAEIAQLYPLQLADGHRAYRIVFRLIEKDEP